MPEKFQLGWEALTTVIITAIGGLTLLWGAVQSNEARIDNMEAAIERIDENTQYLVRREIERVDDLETRGEPDG